MCHQCVLKKDQKKEEISLKELFEKERAALNSQNLTSGGSKGARPRPYGPKCSQFHAVFRKFW